MSEMVELRQALAEIRRRLEATEQRCAELHTSLERAEARITALEAQLAGVPEALRARGTLAESTEHLLRVPRSAVVGAEEPPGKEAR